MARAQKTVGVEVMRNKVNTYLAELPHGKTPEEIERYRNYRLGACTVIETLLFTSNNYKGFSYLDTPYVAGETDESRRYYY